MGIRFGKDGQMTKQADGKRGPMLPDSVESLDEDESPPPNPPTVAREDGSLPDGRSIAYYWLAKTGSSE